MILAAKVIIIHQTEEQSPKNIYNKCFYPATLSKVNGWVRHSGSNRCHDIIFK